MRRTEPLNSNSIVTAQQKSVPTNDNVIEIKDSFTPFWCSSEQKTIAPRREGLIDN